MKLHTFVLLAAAMAAPSVFAQAPPAPSPEVQAARDAVTKSCANEAACTGKTGREMFQCLRANTDKLSAGCKDALSKLPRARRAGPARPVSRSSGSEHRHPSWVPVSRLAIRLAQPIRITSWR